MNLRNLFDLYPDPPLDHTASSYETTNLIACFCAYMRPKIVVEAGTHVGRTSIAMAKVLRQQDVEGFHVYSAEIESELVRKARENVEGNGLSGHITVYEGPFLDMLPTIESEIELAYIDGGERCPIVQETAPRMKAGGLILIDDMNTPWGNADAYKHTLELCMVVLKMNRGLGIIQV